MRRRPSIPALLALAVLVPGCSPAEECLKAFRRQPSVHAFEACKRGCDEENDGSSCLVTSFIYRDGKGEGYQGGPDLAAALRYSKRACQLGNTIGCVTLSLECRLRPEICEEGCARGKAQHCGALASITIKVDRARGLALHRRTCDLGGGCLVGYSASCSYYQPDVCIDRCERGEAEACFWSAALFQLGNSAVKVWRDPDRSRRLLRKACRLDATISTRCAALPAEAPASRATE